MKTCSKCGRTSPPALAQCPRCKTPFSSQAADRSAARQSAGSSRAEKTSSNTVITRTAITAAVLAALFFIIATVLFMNRHRLITPFSQLSGSAPSSSREIIRPTNFNELIGTWSGREINRSAGWTFIFSAGFNVSVSGPEGWYRGKAAIHWEIGTDGKAMRVPPGASNLDVDIEDASVGHYKGKTLVGAFTIVHGTTMQLCFGEPGMSKRPLSFEPASGIRCFELTKTSEALPPLLPPSQSQIPQQVQPSRPALPSAEMPAASAGEAASAREAFKNCIAAYRAGNISEAKKYVASKDLPEMEQSGMFEMAMGMMSGLNIDEFTPSQQGNRMIFKKSDKQGDMTSSMSINMIKEDGEWKFGK